jgi:hypothetical protein
MSPLPVAPRSRELVERRGVRFVAAVTAAVMALALLTPDPWRWFAVGGQALVFGVAAVFGLRRSPYSLVYARVVRPRLNAPAELEDAAPPRFAQLVGLVFLAGALLSVAFGGGRVALILVGFAFVAAVLNAVVGLCLGCELYLLLRRLAPAQTSTPIDGYTHTTGGTT